jgi:Family of unknown function (DUF6029)
MNVQKLTVVLLIAVLCNDAVKAQVFPIKNFSGGLETTNQFYIDDKKGNIQAPKDRFGSNSYFNLNYNSDYVSAGVQFEAYVPVLLGYPVKFDGTKIAHRFVRFKYKKVDLTVGHFYEQYGNGYLFRAYEERQIGIDNVMDGVNIRFNPKNNIRLKATYGRQRSFMDLAPARVRGFDAEIDAINTETNGRNTVLTFGAGFLNRFQEYVGALEEFPQSVTAVGGRMNFNTGTYNLGVEYVTKTAEATFLNDYIYKKGSAFIVNQGFTTKGGLGVNMTGRRLENMDFKSNYNGTDNNASLNFLPALTKQHSYMLANIYPNNTQTISEIGGQADINYFFKKRTALGGKYGMKLSINASIYNGLDTTRVTGKERFTSKFLTFGKTKLFRDLNVTLEKRWNKGFKTTFTAINLYYNKEVLQGGPFGDVNATIGVVDLLFNLNENDALRTEAQHLWAKTDEKNWAGALVEYTHKGLAIFAADMIDYQTKKIHYFNVGMAYNHESSRFSLSFARQRAGLFCVGGICRFLPAFTGLTAGYNVNF